MKIALVHDYLREYGGAERVLSAIHEIWPDAPLFTAFCDLEKMGKFREKFKGWDIRTSWVQKAGIIKNNPSIFAFLTPLVWESFNFDKFDIVISSASWYITKGIITKPSTLHVCYCHTPPRWLWGYPHANRLTKHQPFKAGAFLTAFALRQYDFLAAQRVDHFATNSKNTAGRIKKFYRREAKVIYPPVNLPGEEILKNSATGDYFLIVSRLSKEKGVDYAIEAFNELKLPLKVAGTGNQEEELKKMAGETVEMLGEVSDEKLIGIYQGAKALIFPALEEDFGIVPVEAMGFGKPVIALRQGGVLETVIEGRTGMFFDQPNKESLREAIGRFKAEDYTWKDCRKQAEKFSKENFQKNLKKFVEEKYIEL